MNQKPPYRTRFFLAALIAAILLTATSCEISLSGSGGGGGEGGVTVYTPINTTFARTFAGGIPKDISALNGKIISVLVSFLPADKRESNEGFVTNDPNERDWTINSTSRNVVPVVSRTVQVTQSVTGQSLWDTRMRAAENEILSNGELKTARTVATNYSKVPISIGLNTQWVNITIAHNSSNITATCKKISAHAYFFIDNRDIATMSSHLDEYATAFENIYVSNHTHFGTENDVDNNGKVIIIFSSELTSKNGLLGYFNPTDKFATTSYPDSNEGDIFYLTTKNEYQGEAIKATMAHEFQHMIYFDEHYKLGSSLSYTWINEALSQAAEYYSGYTRSHEIWIQNFLSGGWSTLSLTHWTDINYGYGAVFARYLIARFGVTAIRNMCATNKVGVASVEAATGLDFNTIFYDFTLALVLSGTSATIDNRYSFGTLNLQTVQPVPRKGLKYDSAYTFTAGNGGSSWNYPYEIYFMPASGTFGTVSLSGTDVIGTAFGL